MKPQKYGKIINIASLLAFVGAFNNASYAASKGSVLLQTRSFSNELASHGICVNAIAPGYFKTDLNSPEKMKVLGEEFLTSINLRIPAGHWGSLRTCRALRFSLLPGHQIMSRDFALMWMEAFWPDRRT